MKVTISEGNSDLQEQIKNVGGSMYVGNSKTICPPYFFKIHVNF